MLLHGIWAFKVNAEGGRTDLVLNEPLLDTSLIEETASALVLTEWKVVRKEDSLDDKIDEALKQAELYSQGVLAALELRTYRYLLMVTKDIMSMPPDITNDMITYRIVNIAVEPSTPSVAAKVL